MSTNKILFAFLLSLFIFSFKNVSASVILNEVQLLPTGSRFIELYNNSNEEIDLTGFYIQRKTETGASFSSLVSSTNFENKKIPSKSYFLISRASLDGSDIVLSNLTLTESNTIQIKNAQGEVVDMICWGSTICNGLSISQNPNEGQSIQRGNEELFIANPTPKNINKFSSQNTLIDSNENSSSFNLQNENQKESVSSGSSISNTNKNIEWKLKVEAPNLAFVGTPISLFAQVFDQNNQKIIYGKYFWNFGEGNSKEINSGLGEKFSHTYFYPGEYSVSVFYYKNIYLDEPSLIGKFNVKVIPKNIIISRVGDENDFFIEIENISESSIDLSGFSLRSINKNFTFPKFSVLEIKKKIILSPNTTGFNFEDKEYLKLLDKNEKIIFDYGASIKSANEIVLESLNKKNQNQIIFSESDVNINNKELSEMNDVSNQDEVKNFFEKIENENLSASVSSSINETNGNDKNFYFVFFLVFVFLGGVGIYFIRKNKKEILSGDDFEILER